MPESEKEKPKIEDIASDYLDGEDLNNVLSFVSWLRKNRITPSFGSKSKTGVSYTSSVCYVKLFHGYWYIWISGKHRKHKNMFVNDFLVCKELKEVVSENLPPCTVGCRHKCNQGKGYTVIVCGEKFENICGCCTVRFLNPSTKTLNIIKRVIERRNRIK